jgi:group II intron reverse transcriptase/maturase
MLTAVQAAGRSVKAMSHKTDAHVAGESDGRVVPTKAANNGEHAPAERLEGRRSTKENTGQLALVPDAVPDMDEWRRLLGVRKVAQQDQRVKFTALLHHVTVARLRASFYALKREACPGVDGVTWKAYQGASAADLDARLEKLHDRVHRGTYRAQPSKRAYIAKADGRLRPLGIAALEDKIVQRALAQVLTQIYEVDFLGFSYGFRSGRGQHDALDALWVGLMRKRVNWVLDADIRGFFDTLSHEWLMQFVAHRIADPRVLRLIRKWLRAGVSEDGEWSRTEVGTPQGAVISPLLANIYLHYVFDLWVQRWRTRHATGEVIVVRYADDIVMGFERREDAERCLVAWRERLAQFGLELHPEKTRLIEFGRHAVERRKQRGEGKPETFDFLGFTHISGKTRKGRFTVLRKTIRKRLRAKLKRVKEELRLRRHEPVPAMGRWLRRVVKGYYNYHAVPCNGSSVERFRKEVAKLWLRVLQRRSQRGQRLTWPRFAPIADFWLPVPRILHPWPNVRFDAIHPR